MKLTNRSQWPRVLIANEASLMFSVNCSHIYTSECKVCDAHPINLLGVQVPHLDGLSSWKQQFTIWAHTQTGHCSTVCLPLTVNNNRAWIIMTQSFARRLALQTNMRVRLPFLNFIPEIVSVLQTGLQHPFSKSPKAFGSWKTKSPMKGALSRSI